MTAALDSIGRDVRSAGRMLASRPGWTAAAVLCLAIATGANTAAFTVVNGLLLRPLPFDDPARLVMVALREPSSGVRPFALSEYRELSERSGAAIQLLGRTFFPLSLTGDDGARMAQAELVSGNYFDTLRVTPVLGRFFDASADRAGAPPAVVLSDRLWRVRFGSDRAVVGRSVRVNGRPATVVAVAPPGFVGAMQLVAADLWLPAALYADLAGSPDADNVPMFGVMGRLAPDVTAKGAEARLTPLAAAIRRARGVESPSGVVVTAAAGFGVPVAIQGTLLTLSGFIYLLMVLLVTVACANVAALVLARGVGRTREIAVRLSLGASRLQIARQLIVESVTLAIVGCAAGSLVAIWLTQALVARLTTPFQYVSFAIDVHPDARVFAYSAITTALAAVLCGIAPVRYAARVDVLDVLKQSEAKGRSRASARTLNALVAVQFAVSTALLAAAGSLLRTYANAASPPRGFDARGLILATLDLDQIRLDRAAGARFFQTAMTRLAALPGATAVALTRDLPLRSARTVTAAVDAGRTVPVAARIVSPRYFQTLGMIIREGRSFGDGDPPRPPVAVINESMARRLWPDASPLGRTFRIDHEGGEPIHVIGIVANASETSSAQPPQPGFYRPFPAEYAAHLTIVLRVRGDPVPFFGEIRRTVRDLAPDLSIVDLRTMQGVIDDAAEQRRVPATALAALALLGLVLSAVGLSGVMAYGVRERARELGVRLALGARPADVRWLVLRQGFRIVAAGLAAGAAGTVAFLQIARRHLFGVGAPDAAVLLAVCAVLLAAAGVALYLPARWASAIEPARTLRSE